MTSFVELGQAHATDKGTKHSYLEVYDVLLARHRATTRRVLEVGTYQGASLSLWLEAFPTAEVWGVDVRPQPIPDQPRLTYVEGDAYQLDLVGRLPIFDVIIDDGPHTAASQKFAVAHYSALLAPGGTLIVEDVPSMERAAELHRSTPPTLRRHAFTIDRRPVNDRHDDILFVVDLGGSE